ncbi:MAG: hypothetical protein COV44_06160 [Deltaproteobacteria bacterium CG11_big_fil_rev_8_21_14_0_20_45_16]|nr:MAG: hypothetical protein COV44_06160 [Deltaproteobacteria bacterium CG11_big_fil_rev_8_21_14_0_20_45_16]
MKAFVEKLSLCFLLAASFSLHASASKPKEEKESLQKTKVKVFLEDYASKIGTASKAEIAVYYTERLKNILGPKLLENLSSTKAFDSKEVEILDFKEKGDRVFVKWNIKGRDTKLSKWYVLIPSKEKTPYQIFDITEDL